MRVALKAHSGEAVDIYSVHSPSSAKRPLIATVRQHILEWFEDKAGSRALIVGDLNSNRFALDNGFKGRRDIGYCFENDRVFRLRKACHAM